MTAKLNISRVYFLTSIGTIVIDWLVIIYGPRLGPFPSGVFEGIASTAPLFGLFLVVLGFVLLIVLILRKSRHKKFLIAGLILNIVSLFFSGQILI